MENDILNAVLEFPSPCGVNIVGNLAPTAIVATTVFVEVSVPLRGKYCREFNGTLPKSLKKVLFPSPCGVNIVGNGVKRHHGRRLRVTHGFRPLAG